MASTTSWTKSWTVAWSTTFDINEAEVPDNVITTDAGDPITTDSGDYIVTD